MTSQEKNIQEMQLLEQNLHNLLLKKQAFQIELSETQAALKEIEDANDDIFKVVGELMIKTEKSKIKKELSEKEKMVELRLKTIEKQEQMLAEKIDSLREELMKQLKNKYIHKSPKYL